MTRKALIIAYHFPPLQGSSGIQRTLALSQYLHKFGWQPIILSASPEAYPETSETLLADVPKNVLVERAFAIDSARHLSFRGRYFDWTAIPDRWRFWYQGAVLAGRRLIRQHRPEVVWSTYPIATAHVIGASLARYGQLPWVADFRDSMTEEHYPEDPRRRRKYLEIEKNTVKRCDRAVFTTPSAVRMYEDRYRDEPSNKWCQISNGYNEDIFREVEKELRHRESLDQSGAPFKIIHSGVVYPSERDPTHFFDALMALKREGQINAASLNVILRATGHDEHFSRMLKERGIEDIVSLEPAVPYREALLEMLTADALLLMQASNCNHQIPAKLYEYLRAGKPILALTDPVGDTAAALRDAGHGAISPLNDIQSIKAHLSAITSGATRGRQETTAKTRVESYSREYGVGSLAKIFDELTQSPSTASGLK